MTEKQLFTIPHYVSIGPEGFTVAEVPVDIEVEVKFVKLDDFCARVVNVGWSLVSVRVFGEDDERTFTPHGTELDEDMDVLRDWLLDAIEGDPYVDSEVHELVLEKINS